MENLNEVIPAEKKLQPINAVKCSHGGAKRVETKVSGNKTYCMLCDSVIDDE
jgi:hypothetical protein